MKANSGSSALYQTGFTLVEIMVGLAIGMLATVVIIQVISVFEAQRRTTTGTADAQTNGGIALYNIGRELQMAGYPLMPMKTNSTLACATLKVNGVADATVPNRLSSLVIADGVATAGVSASDTITIRYGTSPTGGVPNTINFIGVTGANDATVDNNFGCRVGDTAIVVNGTSCALTTVTGPTDIANPPVISAPPNLNTTTITLQNITAEVVQKANLSCPGTWNEVTYAVNPASGNLERTVVTNFGPADTKAVVTGIVNLQAQYGVSVAADSNQVTQWVNASGGTWGAPTVANRNRIKAVRIAVVARNAKMEPTNVTEDCTSTTAAAPTGLCAWAGSAASPAPVIDLSAGDANWRRYRYRVFETIIPLRNMIWSRETL
ncbi:MAG: PilW family protein [Burkholderiales bacterium]|nr:PilW family protein [Burkholderiales bacterium]